MGSVHEAECFDCHHKFQYSDIGGFNFAIVNCTMCHQAKSISWEEKSTADTHGECKCGGIFSNDAKPRCPQCNSKKIRDLGTILYFD